MNANPYAMWTLAELTETARRIEQGLKPGSRYLMSGTSIASETLRLHRVKREITRRWIEQRQT